MTEEGKIKLNLGINIFLDDERFPPKDFNYSIVRNYDDFVYMIENFGIPNFISFDHDLGLGKTGFDCAKFLVDRMLNQNVNYRIEYTVHSQNPVGKENIQGLLDNWNLEIAKKKWKQDALNRAAFIKTLEGE